MKAGLRLAFDVRRYPWLHCHIPPCASAPGRGHPFRVASGLSLGTALRANVYVDAFNLYYGAVRGTPYKWLDLAKLSVGLVPRDSINRIRYFTARIHAQGDPQQPQRQQVYIRALETIPNLSVHYATTCRW